MKLSKLKFGPLSIFSPPDEGQLANAQAEKELAKTKRKLANQSKVLLLGSGDSGKSTILKQMRVINAVPFSPTEVESFRQLVFTNLVNGVRLVVDIMQSLDIPLSQSAYQTYLQVETAPDVRQGEPFPQSYQPLFERFWADKQIQKGVKEGNNLALPDNLNYFFSDLPRLFHPTYEPSLQDIIFCRARTTGITETVFKARPGATNEIHMIDVGGQKSERRKWIHCFQGVTAILFLVSLSGYDQCLAEDREANQMQDSMTIWDGIVNNQFFIKTSMILFLNKEDLFAEKVKHSDIVDTFPDYDGPRYDPEAGKRYFRRRFLRLAAKAPRMKGREVYPYFTNATNTPLVKLVLAAISDIILRGNLTESQLI